jgi:hypothetical protein
MYHNNLRLDQLLQKDGEPKCKHLYGGPIPEEGVDRAGILSFVILVWQVRDRDGKAHLRN